VSADRLLAERAHRLVGRVEELLDDAAYPDVTARGDVVDELESTTTELQDALRRPDRTDAAGTALLGRVLMDLTRLQSELREHTVERRFGTVARIHEGLARLRRIGSVAELLPAAAEELGRCCDFDRTVISRRRGSTWRAEAIWMTGEVDPVVAAETRAYLTEQWIPLRSGTLENDLVHRRTAAVISADDPRVDHELVTATHSRQYVASPIMPSGEVIGFLQVDCSLRQRALTELDRDNLWTFAEGFGLIFEHLALHERLEEQRVRVRDAFTAAERGLAELSTAELLLTRHDERPESAPEAPAAQTSRLDALISRREREVLDLMVTGATNNEIAERLVLAEATVKSHVRRIAAKLHASSRADAVSRDLRLKLKERV
jgi:DNA-binding CsgD family transcriptional regulator